jgi:hypothetical protein
VTVPFVGLCAVCAERVCSMRSCVFIDDLFCAVDVRVCVFVCVCVLASGCSCVRLLVLIDSSD